MQKYRFYNESRKKEYLKWDSSRHTKRPAGSLERMFDRISRYEEQYERDVCDFSKTEIIKLYKSLNPSCISSLDVMHSNLRIYADWCLQNHLVEDNMNHFCEVERETFFGCINQARINLNTITYEEIQGFASDMYNASDAFLLLAMFEGIKGKDYCELLNVKLSDFDLTTHTVKLCTGRVLPVSDKLLGFATIGAEDKSYYSFGEHPRAISFVENDDTIIKSFNNVKDTVTERQKGRRIYARLNRISRFLGIDGIRTNDIIRSGEIHFVNERCKELGISGHDYLFSDHVKELKERFGIQSFARSTFMLQNGDKLIA